MTVGRVFWGCHSKYTAATLVLKTVVRPQKFIKVNLPFGVFGVRVERTLAVDISSRRELRNAMIAIRQRRNLSIILCNRSFLRKYAFEFDSNLAHGRFFNYQKNFFDNILFFNKWIIIF